MSRRSEFRERGYLHIRHFFPEETVDEVRHDAQRIFVSQLLRLGLIATSETAEDKIESAMYLYFRRCPGEFMNCGKQAQYLISLYAMGVDARIGRILLELGNTRPNISQRPSLYMSSRHLATRDSYWLSPPHQDWRSMQGSLDAVVVWIPLVDVTIPLGALQVVPSSHRLGLLTNEFIDDFGVVSRFRDEDFVSIEMEKGDALFFSAFLVHRSGTNRTESIRWSAQFRFNNLAEPTFIERGYPHAFIYKPVQELLTPEFVPDAECLSGLWKE